jgi:hypothetical protein
MAGNSPKGIFSRIPPSDPGNSQTSSPICKDGMFLSFIGLLPQNFIGEQFCKLMQYCEERSYIV